MFKQDKASPQVGRSMLKLLTDKEQREVAGGPRGPVSPPKPNPCTWIPGSSGGVCR